MPTQLRRLLVAEKSVVAVIIINTIALFVVASTDPGLAHPGPRSELALEAYRIARWVDFGCVVYFLVELSLKLRMQGKAEFWSSGWNRFDSFVVLLSAPVLLTPFFDVGDFSIVLALRLGRLFRLFRVMRFIPNRAHLFEGVKRALRASVGVLLALLLINIVLSLGATQLFGKVAPEYFGDPALSTYSLFRVFTLEGWYEIPDLIASRAHPVVGVLARLYFMAAVFCGGIIGVALAGAVFVDEMTIDNNQVLERKIDRLIDEVAHLRRELDTR